jgi:hypothetical protein
VVPAVGELTQWVLRHQVQPVGPEAGEGHAKPHAWWKVIVENPFFPSALHGDEVTLTVALLLLLGGVFLLGFSEAVTVAIPLVAVFLTANAVVVGAGLIEVFSTPGPFSAWTSALIAGGGGFGGLAGPALLAFPLLVLGLSGFETGVSMMPLVAAEGTDETQRLRSRIRNTRKLLTTAALIMSGYLLAASFVTTVLIRTVPSV